MEEKLSTVLKFKPRIFIHVVGLDDNAVKQETVYKPPADGTKTE
jgi:hypothetical protein